MRGFHGTHTRNVKSIMRDGLREWSCFTVPDEDVTTKRKLASPLDISAFELARDWGDGTVIEVDLTGLGVDLFEDEGDGGSSWEARCPVSIHPRRLTLHPAPQKN